MVSTKECAQPFWTRWRRPSPNCTDGVRNGKNGILGAKKGKMAFWVSMPSYLPLLPSADKHAQIFPEEENHAIRKAAFRQKAQSLDSAHPQHPHHQQQNSSAYKPQRRALRI